MAAAVAASGGVAGPSRSAASDRRPQIDSLRTISLALVVYQHTMRPRGAVLGDIGAAGLVVFFVISGFLITGILLGARARAEESGTAKRGVLLRFYVRRFLRIFPLYYGVLAIAILLGEPATREHFAQLVTYRTNFLLARLGHNVAPITPLWSLAVEEHFYLVWPLVALFAPRRVLGGAIATMVGVSLAARGWVAFHGGSYQAITMPTYASADGIALGCGLALLHRSADDATRSRWTRWALVAGLVLLVVRIVVGSIAGGRAVLHTLHMLPFALVALWALDRADRSALPRWVGHWSLSALGVMSYGMYVFHRYVMHYLGFDAVRGPAVFASVFAVSAALAALSWYGFERPINELKRFVPYVSRRAAAMAPVAVPAGAVALADAASGRIAAGSSRVES